MFSDINAAIEEAIWRRYNGTSAWYNAVIWSPWCRTAITNIRMRCGQRGIS
nr:MAG TPA: contryphan [Caudoviricetes sp.]